MSGNTAIDWTDRIWNPVTGCTRVSPGCDHCYAFALHDKRHIAWKRGTYPDAAPQYRLPFSQMQLLPNRLEDPLHWKKPQRIFVNSMSDLFHPEIPDEYIRRVFQVMGETPQHIFQILTKRPKRMQYIISDMHKENDFATLSGKTPFPWEHIWLGVSVENQKAADERIPLLLNTCAAVRFISAEPLLEAIDLRFVQHDGIVEINALAGTHGVIRPHRGTNNKLDWVIAGGESGKHFRSMDLNWVRSLRDQCYEADIPFFFKQSSGTRPGMNDTLDGQQIKQFPKMIGE